MKRRPDSSRTIFLLIMDNKKDEDVNHVHYKNYVFVLTSACVDDVAEEDVDEDKDSKKYPDDNLWDTHILLVEPGHGSTVLSQMAGMEGNMDEVIDWAIMGGG